LGFGFVRHHNLGAGPVTLLLSSRQATRIQQLPSKTLSKSAEGIVCHAARMFAPTRKGDLFWRGLQSVFLRSGAPLTAIFAAGSDRPWL
jgi:hypothetical protein